MIPIHFSYLRVIPFIFPIYRVIPFIFPIYHVIPFNFPIYRVIPFNFPIYRVIPFIFSNYRMIPFIFPIYRVIPFIFPIYRVILEALFHISFISIGEPNFNNITTTAEWWDWMQGPFLNVAYSDRVTFRFVILFAMFINFNYRVWNNFNGFGFLFVFQVLYFNHALWLFFNYWLHCWLCSQTLNCGKTTYQNIHNILQLMEFGILLMNNL